MLSPSCWGQELPGQGSVPETCPPNTHASGKTMCKVQARVPNLGSPLAYPHPGAPSSAFQHTRRCELRSEPRALTTPSPARGSRQVASEKPQKPGVPVPFTEMPEPRGEAITRPWHRNLSQAGQVTPTAVSVPWAAATCHSSSSWA